MEVESVVVTGANRGIGLEFVKQLIRLPRPPKYVFASYRHENTAQALKDVRDSSNETRVLLIKLDITKPEEIQDARRIVEGTVGERGLTLLINNSGGVQWMGFHDITEENMLFHFSTNTVGPLMVLKEMLPLLQKSAILRAGRLSISRAAVLNISSTAGSITLTPSSPLGDDAVKLMGYRTSKAALNMAMRVVALTLKEEQGILVVNMCPGWVKTAMGTDRAVLDVWDSVSDMMKTLPMLNESDHGTFVDRHGNAIPY